MDKKNKIKILQSNNMDEFLESLRLYAPKYDDLPIEQWDKDIYKHYAEVILGTTVEALEKQEDEIIEYVNMEPIETIE